MKDEFYPKALIIGPMKSGTTWIQGYFETREDICLPKGVKETFFFDRHFAKGIEWYGKHFTTPDIKKKIAIEVAPSYFHNAQAPERIRNTLGDIPVIIVYRDPIRRAWSHFLHRRRYGYTNKSLIEAVKECPDILDASRYSYQIRRWSQSLSHIRIIEFEVLKSNPEKFCRELCSGLNIDSVKMPSEINFESNAARHSPNYILAKIVRVTANLLRKYQFYSIVNVIRDSGLKQLVYGSKPSQIEFTKEYKVFLRNKLRSDMEKYDQIITLLKKKIQES